MASKNFEYYINIRQLNDFANHRYESAFNEAKKQEWIDRSFREYKDILAKNEEKLSAQEHYKLSEGVYRAHAKVHNDLEKFYERVTQKTVADHINAFNVLETEYGKVESGFVRAKQSKPTVEEFRVLDNIVKIMSKTHCDAVLKGLKAEFNAYTKPISAADIATFKDKVKIAKTECDKAIKNSYSQLPLIYYANYSVNFIEQVLNVLKIESDIARSIGDIQICRLKLLDNLTDITDPTAIADEIAKIDALKLGELGSTIYGLALDAMNASNITPTLGDIQGFISFIHDASQNFDIFLKEVDGVIVAP